MVILFEFSMQECPLASLADFVSVWVLLTLLVQSHTSYWIWESTLSVVAGYSRMMSLLSCYLAWSGASLRHCWYTNGVVLGEGGNIWKCKNTIVQWNKDSLLLRVSQLLRWEVVCKILRQVVQKIYKESQQLKIVGPCCCLDTKASIPLLFVDQREIREAPLCSSR